MLLYTTRRLLGMIPLLLAISMAIFGLVQLQPGDFIDELKLANPKMTAADVIRLRHDYGLDKPWYVQYGKWLSRAAVLDFGLSRENGYIPAAEYVFQQRLRNTLTLSTLSFVFSLLVGLPIGIYAAVKQYSFLDYVTTFLSFVGYSIPVFWLGIMMLLLFGAKLKWFPTDGMQTEGVSITVDSAEQFKLNGQILSVTQNAEGQPVLSVSVYNETTKLEESKNVTLPKGIENYPKVGDYISPGQAIGSRITLSSWWNFVKDSLWHLVLPVIALSLIQIATWTRFMRASLLEVINQDFVRTAKGKGLTERVVIYKHALRNALIPIITLIGLSMPGVLNGAVLTESVFNWPGMGTALLSSVVQKDYNVAMVILMMLAIATLASNLLADLVYALVDPRIRYN